MPAAEVDRTEQALARAYAYLGQRERASAELRRHLSEKGFEEPIVEQTLAELIRQGYLDDARFARLFAQDKRELEHWGSERIGRALRERGLDRKLVAAALAGQDHTSELEQAVALLRRRCPEPPRDRRGHERALGILLRKGYDSELSLDALNIYKRDTSANSVS
jgi:regulatory protein